MEKVKRNSWLPEYEIRTYKCTIRLNKKELDLLTQKTRDMNQSLSSTIRQLALKSHVTVQARFDIEASLQLKRIGVNINQCIKYLLVNQDIDNKKVYFDELNKCIEMLREALKKQ